MRTDQAFRALLVCLLAGAGLAVVPSSATVAAQGAGGRAAAPASVAAKIAYAEPGISPDGREIAFVSGGDIWTVPATGGDARLLVSHPSTESRPLYAPDGKSIAFSSTRTGNGDIYVLALDSGELTRLTYDDNAETPTGWSPDSRTLYFMSTSQDLGNMNDLFRVAVEGGTPMPVTNEPYFNEFFGTSAPDGQRLAFSARGIAAGQWWRHGHSHLDESELWLTTIATGAGGASSMSAGASTSAKAAGAAATGARYERVTMPGAKALWPMWSADGRALFFVSDRNGAENIWRTPLASSSAGAIGQARAAASGAATPGPAASAGAIKDEAKAVTSFTDGRVLWPSISTDGKTIAFERDFAIWTLDTTSGRAQALSIARRGAPAGASSEHLRLANGFENLALSPDGKKVAFSAHGDLFAASAKDGGDAMRLTETTAIETAPVWTPDSRRLVYAADRGDTSELHVYDFGIAASADGIAGADAAASATPTAAAPTSTPIAAGVATADTTLTREHRDYAPKVAPNGESVAFLRNASELCVASLKSSKAAARCLAKAAVSVSLDADRSLTWSPDSKWIAFLSSGAKSFTNVQVIAATGGEAKPVSFLANVNSDSITWSADGSYLLFTSGQRTEETQVARVDLVLRTPKFREDQFRELFPSQPSTPDRTAEPSSPAPSTTTTTTTTPAAPAPATPAQRSTSTPATAPSPSDTTAKPGAPATASAAAASTAVAAAKKPASVDIVFDDIRRRLAYLPVGVDANSLTISPDGKTLLLVASSAGQENLYTWPLDELAKEPAVARQLTSTAGSKSDPQFTPDSKEVYYLDAGRIQVVAVEQRQPRPLAVTAELDVDFAIERNTVFTQAWSLLDQHFFDPAFHGVSWPQAREHYAPYAAGAATPDELRRITGLMIGELNASHLGISAPPVANTITGRLGLRFDRDEYARSGRLQIAEIIPLGPAAVTRALAVGDVLLAVNNTALARTTNLDRLLEHTVGKRVLLTIEPKRINDGTPATRKTVAVQPVNLTTERGLLYRQWVESRRAYVAKASGGRLGYVHMVDMSAAALAQLYIDLDADNHARDGVVIDVRNNNGGFVNAYALDVFARRPYLNMTMRARPTTPARSMLGQRALELPTVLVTNQHSLSDAEDFSEGYRRLKLGKVVGEPTGGWIIYTWNTRLVDGTVLRLPRIRITDVDGKDMELSPRPVDVAVTRQPGEVPAGRDVQLDAAVRELLAQVGARTPATTAGSR